jgi:hypothetical protein
MFGTDKLLKEGTQGTGIVVETKEGSTDRLMVFSWHVKVQAHFDDGSTGEIKTTLHVHQKGMIPRDDLVLGVKVGDKVPIRFDPKDHSKVEVNIPELHARRLEFDAQEKKRKAAQDAQAVARAEQELKQGKRK